MSWKEYKKKREQGLDDEDITTSIKTDTSTRSTKMSSWEKYKNDMKENKVSDTTLSTKEKEDEQKWYEGIFKSGAYADGYQKGDFLKTVGSTVGDVGVNLVKGASGLVEGVGDIATYGIADAVGFFGNETKANQMRENAKKNTVDAIFNPLEDAVDKNSVFDDKADEVVKGLGYVAAITAVGALTGGAGAALGASTGTAATVGTTATTFVSAMGNNMSEALNDGATLEEARVYGVISGLAEAGSELMFGGLGKASEAFGLSKGALDDVIVGGLTKNIKHKLTKTIIQSGLKAGGEGFEEVVSGFISGMAKRYTYMKQGDNFFEKVADTWKNENLAEQFWMGTITSAIAQVPSTYNSAMRGTDYLTGRTQNEQKVYDSELNTRKEAKTREATIEKAYNEQIKTYEDLGIKIKDRAKSIIMQKVENAYDEGTLDKLELSKKDINKIEEQLDTDMEEGNISIEGIRKALGENFDIDKKKDITLMKSMYENAQKYEDFQYKKTDNEKVNKLMQSAVDAGFNNTNKTRKKVELIAKLTKDTDRQYKFVSPEQLKQMGYNENANGLIDKSTGDILINAHTEKGIMAVVGHETTHIFDTKKKQGEGKHSITEYSKEYIELQKAAFEYAKVKGIYESKFQSVKNAYRKHLLSEVQLKEELTADLIGDFLYNDEAFIEQLSVKNKNIFQKIYDYIKHAYTMAKGTDEEKAFEELKSKFEKVYKTVGKTNNQATEEGPQYSFTAATAEERAKAEELEKQKLSPEEIYLETGLYRGADDRWRREISDSKSKIILEADKIEVGDTYKLSNVLKHPEIYKAYPELKKVNIKIVDDIDLDYSGMFHPDTNTIDLGISLINKNEKSKRYLKDILSKINENDKTMAFLYSDEELKTLEKKYKEELKNHKPTTYQKELKSVLLHEIQHWIQEEHGFAKGNNVENLERIRDNYNRHVGEINQEIESYYKDIGLKEWINENVKRVQNDEMTIDQFFEEQEQFKLNSKYGEQIKELKEDLDKYQNRYGVYKRTAKDLYYNTAGEIEAREVQKRIDYTEEQRKNEMPFIKDENTYYRETRLNYKNGVIKYSLTDNNGKKLSKEQQEYFKDSKVRDENGNLLRVYHGTASDFTMFDEAFASEGDYGIGFYFTDSKNVAQESAEISAVEKDISAYMNGTNKGKVMEQYLNMKNPSVWHNYKDINKYKALAEQEGMSFYDYMRKNYDGIIVTKPRYDNEGYGDAKYYIVFNSNQIKNIDNTNPTTNPDIRYSLSEDMSKRYGEIKEQRNNLLKQLSELRQERNDIIETIPNYRRFTHYHELEDIDKRIDDNINLSKQLYAEQEEIETKIKEIKEQEKKERIAREEAEATPFKLAQNRIIQETNPMLDDYHTGIRSVGDIRTWEEAMSDAEKNEDGYAWGDFTKEDAERALKNNSITIYSSYPIKNGVFVSTSYVQAEQYAGGPGRRVYSKTIKPERVAWISVDEGQYASVKPSDIRYSLTQDNQGRKLSEQQKEYFKESKVVDENGNLLEVYHGTAETFTKFEKDMIGSNYYQDAQGFFFTDDIETAEGYANTTSYGMPRENPGNVMKTYLNLQNPLIIKIDYDSIGYWDENFESIIKKANKNGNDGVIIKAQKYGSLYVAFESNQIKNVENTNPTENDDINLSLTKDTPITGDDIAVRDMLKQERPTIEDEIGKTEAPTVEEVITQTPEEKEQGMKEKAKKYLSRSKTRFINKIVEDFGTSKIANTKTLNTVVDNIREDIQENGPLTKEKADSYFNELYNNLVTIDTLYYDTYKDVKDNIRATKLYISDEIKSDITDYNEFRKRNMGTLLMTSDSKNLSVDSYYQEMSDLYPELFPDDIINPTDQLERISEVAKDITKVETNVAAYNDKYMGADYRDWARVEFDKNINAFMQDIKLADRYNTETNEKEKIGVDKETVKNIYKQLPDARKAYEKVLAKELLTKEDKVQVDRLLNNEITAQEIPEGLNRKGIMNVASAKYEYDTLQKMIKEYQDSIRSSRMEQAKEDIGDLNLWKDKKTGFKYSRETAIRNIYDVAPEAIADKVVNKYFRSYIEVNEKKVTDAINGYNDRIRNLNIGTKNKYEITFDGETNKVSESALIQLLGEKKISTDDVKNSGADVTKIENAVKEFRNIYNELIAQINESMLDNGYAPVEYRKDYFPHFTEETTDTILGKAAKLLGIDITNREELPTDIAGQTYKFKPGRTWFSNILQRTTDATDYDALKGFDKYVRGATDLIYHTGDIQNLRALSTVIRGTYNDTELQNRITEINESTMSDLEKSEAIQDVYDKAKDKSHLSKFVEWLDNYTNLIAGKKAINDRGLEKELNRQMYKTMQDIESRIAANAIGGNIGVSLTNFAPISQAWGEVKTTNLINGIWQTMKASIAKDNSLASESQFITRRRGADTLSETTLEKVTKPINSVLEFADKFTSEVIVRARYNQNLQEGMSPELALQEADRYTAGLMADRGRGALPTQFSNKNPISKMINMFQVEVNNQWSYYTKDLPKNIKEKANNNKAKIVADTAMAYTKIMVGAYLTNELLGAIRGNSTRVLPDPIYIIAELLKGLTDDDDDNDDDAVIGAITEVAGNVPFVSLPATLLADSLGLDVGDIGRIPISGAIPNVKDILTDTIDVVKGEKTVGEGLKSIGGELADTIGASLILPYGGSQIKKTVKGLSLYANDLPGSYTDSGDLRYTVEEDVGSKVQAALFGAYANPYAQDYIDSGFKAIKKDNIEEMVGLDMNSTEYRQYKKGLSKVSDTSDKNGYKQYTDENNNVYWYDADTETMYDNKYKKTTLTEDDLIKVSKKEESLNYINTLDLTEEQKNIAANNLNKNSKKKIDMTEYSNYSSYDEYTYARDYPKKYSVVSQIAPYDDYVKYKEEIADIKKRYSTELGYESKERKAAVQSYINSLDLNIYQKMMLEKMAGGYSVKNYQNYIYEYLETTGLSQSEKYTIWEELFN